MSDLHPLQLGITTLLMMSDLSPVTLEENIAFDFFPFFADPEASHSMQVDC